MSEENKYTIEDANHYFAVEYNNSIWPLLEKNEKSDDAYDEIINLAHASLLHWSRSPKCKKANLARGEFMVTIAYLHAGRRNAALYHAERGMKLTKDFQSEMEDFDLAYAAMEMAGALHLADKKDEAAQYLEEAKALGEKIKDPEDKKIYMNDLDTFIKNGYRL